MPSDLDWEDEGESVAALDSVLLPVPEGHDRPDDAVIDEPSL
jgi:hypothetical protein